jgi:hypothetical protein
LDSIGGGFLVQDNEKLVNFIGFNRTKTIRGKIEILDNGTLKSLDGLENLKNGRSTLDIYYNNNLSGYCSIKALTLGGSAYIMQNKFNPSWAQIKAGDCSR